MVFDIKSAKPISSGFDIKTAKPIGGGRPNPRDYPILEPMDTKSRLERIAGGGAMKNVIPEAGRALKFAGSVIKGAPGVIKSAYENPSQILPTVKNIGVGMIEGLGQAVTNRIIDPEGSYRSIDKSVIENPLMTTATVIGGVPGASKMIASDAAKLLDKASVAFEKGHLGLKVPTGKGVTAFKKAEISKRNTEIAKMALKEKLNSNIGDAAKTLKNTENLIEDTQRGLATLRESLQETQMAALDPLVVEAKLRKELTGLVNTEQEKQAIKEAIDIVKQNGEYPLDFKTSQAIVEKIQKLGKYDKGIPIAGDPSKASVFARAGGILSDMLDDSVVSVAGKVGKPEIAVQLDKYKKLYGLAEGAQGELATKVAREGNLSQLGYMGLRTTILGGAGYAHGGIGEAALIAAGTEIAKKYGLGTAANVLKYGAKGVEKFGNLGVPKGYLSNKLKYTGQGALKGERGSILLGKGDTEPLINEALKHDTVEGFIKAQGEPVYHGGSRLDKINDTNDSNYGAFYVTDKPEYAKSFGGSKSVVNDVFIDPKAKLIDLRKPTDEQILEIMQGIEKEKLKPSEYGKGFSFHPFTESKVIEGMKRGDAHYLEMPQIKKILKDVGYDGQITSEVPYAKNIGIWNKDVVKTKPQLTDIWNKAHKLEYKGK